MTTPPAAAHGTVTLGATDPITVNRLGFGAMRITGAGIWGAPSDPASAISVLRRAAELGVDFIDTADSYGPFVSEDLIREALHPYDGIVIATKGGLTRQGPDRWTPVGVPAYLRQCVEMSLRRLDVERIDLWQLHRIDPAVPMEDQAAVVAELVAEGKIRHVGLSEVTVEQLEAFAALVPVVSVQNMYNVGQRNHEPLVSHCESTARAFIPWFPVAAGPLAREGGANTARTDTGASVADEVGRIAAEAGLSRSTVALAWLLQRSPAMLPIPGTSSVAHLEENVAAAAARLSADTMATLNALAS